MRVSMKSVWIGWSKSKFFPWKLYFELQKKFFSCYIIAWLDPINVPTPPKKKIKKKEAYSFKGGCGGA